jgi:hypothetical protein
MSVNTNPRFAALVNIDSPEPDVSLRTDDELAEKQLLTLKTYKKLELRAFDEAKREYAQERAEAAGDSYEHDVAEAMRQLRVRNEANLRHSASDEALGDTWEELDLAAIYANGIEPPIPSIVDRGDGVGLFYKGLPNVIFGESGAGKTALVQWIAASEMLAGRHVYHIDWETNVYVWLNRFRALGIPDEIVTEHYHPFDMSRGLKPPTKYHPDASVAIIDSLTSAIAATGSDPNAMDGIEKAYRQFVTPFTRAGLAAVVIDHVGHGDKKRMVNSTRKKGIVQGAIYRVEGVQGSPFGYGREGMSALHVFKDNMGGTKCGIENVAATFTMASDENGQNMRCSLQRPSATVNLALMVQQDDLLRNKRRQDIYEVLAEMAGDPPTKSGIYDVVRGDHKIFTAILDEMVADGVVSKIRLAGERADRYTTDRP